MTVSITLEARNPARDCWRSYSVAAFRDLLSDWIVEVRFGRIGAGGQGRLLRHVFTDEALARHKVRDCIKRRRSAPKRIEAAYVVTALDDPAGWLAEIGLHNPKRRPGGI